MGHDGMDEVRGGGKCNVLTRVSFKYGCCKWSIRVGGVLLWMAY